MHSQRKSCKGLLSRNTRRVDSRCSWSNSPDEALHVVESGLALRRPVPKMSETQTYTQIIIIIIIIIRQEQGKSKDNARQDQDRNKDKGQEQDKSRTRTGQEKDKNIIIIIITTTTIIKQDKSGQKRKKTVNQITKETTAITDVNHDSLRHN